MKSDEGLAAALFAVVIGGAVAFGIANDVSAPACVAAKSALANAKDFDFGCLEFWLNRYQATIAAIAAAGIALFVVRPAFRQLDEMAKQSAASARAHTEQFAADIEAELDSVAQVASAAFFLRLDLYDFDVEAWDWTEDLDRTSIIAAGRKLLDDMAPTRRNLRRQLDNSVASARAKYLTTMGEFAFAAQRYAAAVTGNTVAARAGGDRLVRANRALDRAGKKAATAYDAAEDAANELKALLSEISRQRWSDVRELERRAEGKG